MIHGDDRVESRLDDRPRPRLALAPRGFDARPDDELSDLVADDRDGREQVGVRSGGGPAEAFDDPEHVGAESNRKAEGTVKARLARHGTAGEVGIAAQVFDPGGLAGRPDATRKADAARKGALFRRR